MDKPGYSTKKLKTGTCSKVDKLMFFSFQTTSFQLFVVSSKMC